MLEVIETEDDWAVVAACVMAGAAAASSHEHGSSGGLDALGLSSPVLGLWHPLFQPF